MKIDYHKFELHGKVVFEKGRVKTPYQQPNILQDEACFLYILDGVGIEISENSEQEVFAKESILLKCGNYIARMHSASDNETYAAFVVHFHSDVLKNIYQNNLPKFLTTEVQNSSQTTMAKLAPNLLIDKFINEFLIYFENPHLVTPDLLELKLKEIILLLYNSPSGDDIKLILSNLFTPIQFSLQQIVEAHLYRNTTVEELAILCNMSISTFKREFKRIFNDNPAGYLRKKKMAKAGELIRQTKLRISEIAEECGFEDVSHFSNTFYRFFGKYPSSYRLN